jgi:hypothetical protein
MAFYRSHILVSVDPICLAKGAHEIIDALQNELVAQGLIDEVQVLETSRIGDPAQFAPDLIVYPEGTLSQISPSWLRSTSSKDVWSRS